MMPVTDADSGTWSGGGTPIQTMTRTSWIMRSCFGTQGEQYVSRTIDMWKVSLPAPVGTSGLRRSDFQPPAPLIGGAGMFSLPNRWGTTCAAEHGLQPAAGAIMSRRG